MGGSSLDGHNYYGARATLKPVVPDLEPDWWKDDARQEYIMDLQVGLHSTAYFGLFFEHTLILCGTLT